MHVTCLVFFHRRMIYHVTLPATSEQVTSYSYTRLEGVPHYWSPYRPRTHILPLSILASWKNLQVLYISQGLPENLSDNLFDSLSIWEVIYLLIHLPDSLSICEFIFLTVYWSDNLPNNLCLTKYPCVNLSIWWLIYLTFFCLTVFQFW